jgi:hypothetical protein
MAQTHDYTISRWGHDLVIMTTHEGGARIDASGWGEGISKGDYIVFLRSEAGWATGETTRYLVDKIEYKRDPADMWFAKLVFAPRKLNADATAYLPDDETVQS